MSVSLDKGQSVSLAKSDGGSLHHIRLGLGWDAAESTSRGLFGMKKSSRSIDLDASALLVDASGSVVDTVWFGQLRSRDGSVQHTGDNLTGRGEGDDESIVVDLDVLPESVKHIVFTVNSFSGQGFSEVARAYVRVIDTDSRDEELARVDLSETGPHTAIIMARVSREGSGWSFTSIGALASGRSVANVKPAVSRLFD